MRQANQQFSSVFTKIGNGEQLDEMAITLIGSRFRTVEEAEASAHADRITSTAKDVSVGCISQEQETFAHQKLHKMLLIDTYGLPYQTVDVNNINYLRTSNIDVTDRLSNGTVGKLIHLETNDEGCVRTIWLEFPDLPQIGEN
ncbi:ATP-dependent DNA helicase [Trichonephila clavipes]|nr:ATP-dependent DNA helicase [Trichonephila clavipes]